MSDYAYNIYKNNIYKSSNKIEIFYLLLFMLLPYCLIVISQFTYCLRLNAYVFLCAMALTLKKSVPCL